MATIVKQVRSAKAKYPWSKWMDGKARQVRHGRDFKCSLVSFRNMLYTQAKRQGRTVTASQHGKAIEFKFSTPN